MLESLEHVAADWLETCRWAELGFPDVAGGMVARLALA